MQTTYTGSAYVSASDYKFVKFVGRTKSNHAIMITLPRAICRSNPDWAFAEKGETVPEIQFEGVYDDNELATGNLTEPWQLTLGDGLTAGNGEILLGAGKFYVGNNSGDAKCVGLTRGGGSFVVERNYREINADDDPGAVEGRIEKDEARPKLTLNTLQWLTKVADFYSNIVIGEAPATVYGVKTNLSNCTISNGAAAMTAGSAFSATITATSGTLGAVTVLMDGIDISDDVVTGGSITIPAVTGTVTITASAS